MHIYIHTYFIFCHMYILYCMCDYTNAYAETPTDQFLSP